MKNIDFDGLGPIQDPQSNLNTDPFPIVGQEPMQAKDGATMGVCIGNCVPGDKGDQIAKGLAAFALPGGG